MEQGVNKYHTHISAKRSWFDLKLHELWRYRDLVMLFTKRNFILVYKQTILGPLWILLQPLMTTLIYAFVFGGIAGISTNGAPKLLFYLGGTALWGFFSACLTKTSTTFSANSRIFGRVYFPRLVTPISTVFSAGISFGVQFLLFTGFLVYYIIVGEVIPNYIGILLLPFILLYLGVLGMGLGLIITALTTKYRDLAMLVTYGVQLWMYITPIVYPASTVANSKFYSLIMLNPVTCAVETFRWTFLGVGELNLTYWLISIGITAIVAFLGIIIFNRVEKTFMDTI